MSFRVEAAVDAVDTYLQDASYGFNVQIAAHRTELGLTADELPNVAEFSKWGWRPEKASAFPHLNLYARETRGELLEANSRMYEVDVEVTLIAPGKAFEAQTVDGANLAMWRYFDALQDLINRRTSGSEGVNLAMGASGRVLFASLGRASVGGIQAQSGRMNVALQALLTVTMIEDW